MIAPPLMCSERDTSSTTTLVAYTLPRQWIFNSGCLWSHSNELNHSRGSNPSFSRCQGPTGSPSRIRVWRWRFKSDRNIYSKLNKQFSQGRLTPSLMLRNGYFTMSVQGLLLCKGYPDALIATTTPMDAASGPASLLAWLARRQNALGEFRSMDSPVWMATDNSDYSQYNSYVCPTHAKSWHILYRQMDGECTTSCARKCSISYKAMIWTLWWTVMDLYLHLNNQKVTWRIVIHWDICLFFDRAVTKSLLWNIIYLYLTMATRPSFRLPYWYYILPDCRFES